MDDLYGDLYGDVAEPASAPQASTDPRRQASGPLQPAFQHNYQSQPAAGPSGSSYSTIQTFVSNDAPSSRPQPSYGQQAPRTINTFHDSNEHRNFPQRGPPGGGGAGAPQYEDGKMFIGGLSWETTEENLQAYFGQYGTVTSASVMRDSSNGRSRGFAFLSFADPSSVNSVMAHQHFLDGKQIDPKRAVPPPNKRAALEEPRTEKLFVRSIAPEVTQQAFQAYFAKFGPYSAATLMMDRETGINRGYGFVDYESPDSVDQVLNSMPHYVDGHLVDTKKSHPKPRRDGQGGGPNDGAAYSQPVPQAAASLAPTPQPQGGMSGPFNAQTIADYFRKMTGGDLSKLAGFDPQRMFAEIALMAPPPSAAAAPTQSYTASAPRPQGGLQKIATFLSDEPPTLRKAVAQHAGFDEGYEESQYSVPMRGEPPADAPSGPRGGGRYHPYAR